MNSILITGCNRGLGLGLVKALVALPKPPKHVFATCRNKEQAKELQQLAAQHPNIHIIEIDLLNFNEYDRVVKEIDDITQGQGLNVLFNNAAISSNEQSLSTVKADEMLNTLNVNVVVPLMFTKACLPLLEKASKLNDNMEMGLQRAAIINMSSLLGSIEKNTWGSYYSYGTSKTALNSITKALSVDLASQKILCVSMHPGWVRTDMGGPMAPLEVGSTTTEIIDTILKFNAKHHGGFYQHDGQQLPW
ncbi:SDR family oxidoreductase sniffer isoform X1 [Musca autumnalis]|uniref:SDR family oxidoreductase sniffer isoform X1 n=1 Tax=Musca autumnalis TaxID=221902 RepID=UPI003CF5FEAE